MTISAAQIRAIQALRRKVGLEEQDYRGLLAKETGKTSARALTVVEGARVIDRLKGLSGPVKAAGNKVSGPYAKKLQALWISGWQLGVVRERDDRALIAFVERQAGISHLRFLTESRAATKAIEALKAWLAREAGVAWPTGRDDVLGSKRAVVAAQWRKLAALGILHVAGSDPSAGLVTLAEVTVGRPVSSLEDLASAELDALVASLGTRIRKGRKP